MTNDARVAVRTDGGSYDVRIGPNRINELGAYLQDNVTHAFVVADANVQYMADTAMAFLTDLAIPATCFAIRATEKAKSFETLQDILGAMTRGRLDRDACVIAIGGGITGDVGGFAAATYRRGIAVIQCPTTLLAMVDASVGGKTGINLMSNHHLHKNMVGSFHQPKLVIADLDALDTLNDRQLRCGMAECVKHAMISADWSDETLFEWTEANADAILARDKAVLAELVERNVAVKARVVEADERESTSSTGGRALLNLGHTFGHALETLPTIRTDQAPPVQHGEAVSLGLVAACHCSASLGQLDRDSVDRVTDLLRRLGLPTQAMGLPSDDELLAIMGSDKKVVRDQLRLVLPNDLGRSSVVAGVATEAIRAGLSAIQQG